MEIAAWFAQEYAQYIDSIWIDITQNLLKRLIPRKPTSQDAICSNSLSKACGILIRIVRNDKHMLSKFIQSPFYHLLSSLSFPPESLNFLPMAFLQDPGRRPPRPTAAPSHSALCAPWRAIASSWANRFVCFFAIVIQRNVNTPCLGLWIMMDYDGLWMEQPPLF